MTSSTELRAKMPFVVTGESLVDVVRPVEGETVRSAGGSPLNVAVGLARLGIPTELITVMGDDDEGRLLTGHLSDSGVRLAAGSVRDDVRTSTATARLNASSAASYDFDLSWDLGDVALPEDALGLHVGSLGTVVLPGRDAVLDLVAQAASRDLFVSYDPNIRPAFVDDPEQAWFEVRSLAAAATLVKLSDEDLHVLRPEMSPSVLAQTLLEGGRTEMVLLTEGADGATAFTGEHRVRLTAPQVEVVDTVGAGDSFMAAALTALLDWRLTRSTALGALDKTLISALLRSAMRAAAVTCSRRGANPPTRRELGSGWPAS